MRLGWHVHLLGPFSLGGTLFRSRRRGPRYHATLPGGWQCPHDHRRPDTAQRCCLAELKRRREATR